MLGQERTVLPLLAERVFQLSAYTAVLTYIVAFGATKALTNFFAGTLSDRYGRKPVLVAGWLIALPVPALLIWGPSWEWIIFANVLLGINQGLTWSTTVIMKIDLVGPHRRGLAMDLNEALRLPRPGRHCPGHRSHRRTHRAAPPTVPARRRLRRPRPRIVQPGCTRNPRARLSSPTACTRTATAGVAA
jgi:Major Facilitator Superfamily